MEGYRLVLGRTGLLAENNGIATHTLVIFIRSGKVIVTVNMCKRHLVLKCSSKFIPCITVKNGIIVLTVGGYIIGQNIYFVTA